MTPSEGRSGRDCLFFNHMDPFGRDMKSKLPSGLDISQGMRALAHQDRHWESTLNDQFVLAAQGNGFGNFPSESIGEMAVRRR